MLARPRIARLGSAAAVLATSGLLGLAAGLPIRPVVEAVGRQAPLPTTCTADFACTGRFLFTQPIVVGALLVAGALFGLVAQRLTRAGSPVAAAAGGALALYAGSFGAALAAVELGGWVDTLLAEVIFHGPYPEWLVVALTFGSVTAGVVGGTTLVVGLAVRARGALWRAVLVTGVVALGYVLVGAILDQQPGWTIGLPEERNNHAMPKVTFVSDVVVGSLGAGLALVLLGGGAPARGASAARGTRSVGARGARRPGLAAYVERHLGRGSSTMLRNWLLRSFGAGTFGGFWRYWNPVYGYVLSYYAYRPLRAVLPRPLAVWLTFVACGFLLHDLVGWLLARQARAPEMTVLFALFGAAVVMSEALRLDLSTRPLPMRVLANCGWLFGAWALTRLILGA